MKKIINNPENLVHEMCNGLVMAHPELEFLSKYKVVKKQQIDNKKVTLISGGGSGHEPAHAGFVGKGMLDAAVCGDVFASPSQIQVYKGVLASKSDAGVLLVIKNYSGDLMNFKNAQFLAQQEGVDVEYVIVDDDISVEDSLYTVGKRGVAGTVFVHKIAGAAAERGDSLIQVKEMGEHVVKNMASMGFALTSCTVPAKGTPTFALGEDEMEFGVGIHGEPGIQRQKVASSKELAKSMVERLTAHLGIEKGSNEEIAVLVNGFGGTPLQELYLFNNDVMAELSQYTSSFGHVMVGNYMTSIDMAGGSITLLKLDAETKSLLKAACDTPALKLTGTENTPFQYQELVMEEKKNDDTVSFTVETAIEHSEIKENQLTLDNMKFIVDQMSECIIRNEVPFCELDSHAGDGDFGMSVAKGFRELKREWQYILETSTDISSFLSECSLIIMEYCGGASGPIWGSAFRYASISAKGKNALSTADFAEMLQAAVKGIQETGERSFGRGAVVGDKTLIDALVPCADIWTNTVKEDVSVSFKTLFEMGAKAAVEGAEYTKTIVARMGRAGTVGERSLSYPDAGAHGLGIIFTELAEKIK